MQFLNLGIVAHVDAGKTSLTERLLHHAGVIDELGSVDAGNTQTDTLALERRRGITIKSAVVAFAIDDVAVNLIDTPGHPDFIAEVERVLRVLDGAVLVVSAVEGVQAQTRVLMRTLKRLRIPTLIFVNKTDRRGADPERVAREVAGKLRIAAAPIGSTELAELLADHADAFLAAYLDGGARVREELAAQTRRALVHPVFRGSAITGAGVDELTRGIRDLLPAATADGPPPAPCSRSSAARRREVAYVRMHAGTLQRPRARRRVEGHRDRGLRARRHRATRRARAAGQIGKVCGPERVRIGDTLGASTRTRRHFFAPPTLETVVDADDRVALHHALTELAEQDPLINLRLDGDELAVSLYGEVQKEVIEATLADEYGLAVALPRDDHDPLRQARRDRRGGRVRSARTSTCHRRPAGRARRGRDVRASRSSSARCRTRSSARSRRP